MNLFEIKKIIADLKYKNWKIEAFQKGETIYLQVQWEEKCNYTGATELQNGRKWLLSDHMVKGEIVQTAFKAVLTAEEHEAREQFFYRGQRIFGPHFDVDALWEISNEKMLDYRKPKKVA